MTLAGDRRPALRSRSFSSARPPSAGAAIELTATLLLVGATFFIADGIQTVAAGALRGMNDTRVPLLFAAISYWLIGFTCACALGFLDAARAPSASGSGCRSGPRFMPILLRLALPPAGEQDWSRR